MKSPPPLEEDFTWLVDARGKFLLKVFFRLKVVGTSFFSAPDVELDDLMPLCMRYTQQLFKKLDNQKQLVRIKFLVIF